MPVLFDFWEWDFSPSRSVVDHILQDITPAPLGFFEILFPIIRLEPFGLVVAEALACGTPVIGSRVSPLPEILKNKKTAFLSNDFKELVSAVKNINRFDRRECRRYAEENFDSAVMAEKYVKVYKSVLNKSSHFWRRA